MLIPVTLETLIVVVWWGDSFGNPSLRVPRNTYPQSEVLCGLRSFHEGHLFTLLRSGFFLNTDQSLRFNCWKTFPQHDAATTLPNVWDGWVMSTAHFPTNIMLRIRIQAKKFSLGFNKPELFQRWAFIRSHYNQMWKEWEGLKTIHVYIDPQIHHYHTSRVPHDDTCLLACLSLVQEMITDFPIIIAEGLLFHAHFLLLPVVFIAGY